jgi:hypothetical protein
VSVVDRSDCRGPEIPSRDGDVGEVDRLGQELKDIVTTASARNLSTKCGTNRAPDGLPSRRDVCAACIRRQGTSPGDYRKRERACGTLVTRRSSLIRAAAEAKISAAEAEVERMRQTLANRPIETLGVPSRGWRPLGIGTYARSSRQITALATVSSAACRKPRVEEGDPQAFTQIAPGRP